jgi:hypothetical protein
MGDLLPGSTVVQKWDFDAGLPPVECGKDISHCPLADENGINHAPFFVEGGEAYALNGRQVKQLRWHCGISSLGCRSLRRQFHHQDNIAGHID